MPQHEQCERCRAKSVVLARREPSGTEVWACSKCGDYKRWCPSCEKGWVRRLRDPSQGFELYSCEECEASWTDADEIDQEGLPIQTFLSRARLRVEYLDFVVVRENENGEDEEE